MSDTRYPAATVAWVLFCVALLLTLGAASHAAPAPTNPDAEACASAIMADLDRAAEGPYLDVPAPRWQWVVDGCAGVDTPGVTGGIQVYEDGSYLIRGYGDEWHGCLSGEPCDDGSWA